MNSHPFLNAKALQYKTVTVLILVLMLLISLSQFAPFALIQNHVMSFYGAQSEDISMAVLAMYAGIVTMLPIHFRLFRYFSANKKVLPLYPISYEIYPHTTHTRIADTPLQLCPRMEKDKQCKRTLLNYVSGTAAGD